jgi:hypothetical protein
MRARIRCQLLFRQFLPGLLADDVVGVPVRPAFVVMADPLFLLAMRCRGTPERAGELARRGKRRVPVYASGQSAGHLLHQPGISVRIAECRQRTITGTLRIRTAEAALRPAVEHLTRIDPAGDEFGARRFDVGHDKIEKRCGAKLDRSRRPRGA